MTGEYLKSLEMAYNTKVLFGAASRTFPWGVTGGGSRSYPRRDPHTIRQPWRS